MSLQLSTAMGMWTLAFLPVPLAVSPAIADCAPTVAEYAFENGNEGTGPIGGQSVGQTFFAHGPAIDSIVVWRWPSFSDIGVRLYVVGTDSAGIPNTSAVLLRTAPLVSNDIDERTGFIKLLFVFAPPLELPAAGSYAMLFQAADCWDGDPWRLLVDTEGEYHAGMFWLTNRTFPEHCVPFNPRPIPARDMVFAVYFCQGGVVENRRRTWGRLKGLYR